MQLALTSLWLLLLVLLVLAAASASAAATRTTNNNYSNYKSSSSSSSNRGTVPAAAATTAAFPVNATATWMGDIMRWQKQHNHNQHNQQPSSRTLAATPLNRLRVPGAHDALSSDLGDRVSAEVSPWEQSVLDALLAAGVVGRAATDVIRGWSTTQALGAAGLLGVAGARHLDVRVAWDEACGCFRFFHFLLSRRDLVRDDLAAVRAFMDAHPHELVQLQLSHFVGFRNNQTIQELFVSEVLRLFGDIALPQQEGLGITFEQSFRKGGTRAPAVLLFAYPSEPGFEWLENPLFFDSNAVLQQTWADTPSVSTLWQVQTTFIKNMAPLVNATQFLYPQWLLTEDVEMIVASLAGLPEGTLHTLSRHANGPEGERFFDSPVISRARINLFYSDFVEESGNAARAQAEALFPCYDSQNATWGSRDCAQQAHLCAASAEIRLACQRTCGGCGLHKVAGLPGTPCDRPDACASRRCSTTGICLAFAPAPSGAGCGLPWQCTSGRCDNWKCT